MGLESSVLLLPLWDISAVAGPQVFALAVEETRAKEAEEKDGQLSSECLTSLLDESARE